MSIKLEKLSLPELIQLQSDLEITIKQRQKTERVALRKQMETLAKQSGFTFDEVISAPKARKKITVRAKYENPNNTEQTWTGRGRRPKWVEAELATGKTLEDIMI